MYSIVYTKLNFSLQSQCGYLHSDWSLLLLANTYGSFHRKQGMILETCKVVYTVNKVAYRKHHLQLPVVYGTESTTFSQYMEMISTCCHRNKGEVENISWIYYMKNAHHNVVFLVAFDRFRCHFLDRSKRDLICSFWRKRGRVSDFYPPFQPNPFLA